MLEDESIMQCMAKHSTPNKCVVTVSCYRLKIRTTYTLLLYLSPGSYHERSAHEIADSADTNIPNGPGMEKNYMHVHVYCYSSHNAERHLW